MRTTFIILAFLLSTSAWTQSVVQDIEVRKLGSQINSSSNEKAPFVAPDGNELYL